MHLILGFLHSMLVLKKVLGNLIRLIVPLLEPLREGINGLLEILLFKVPFLKTNHFVFLSSERSKIACRRKTGVRGVLAGSESVLRKIAQGSDRLGRNSWIYSCVFSPDVSG